MKVAAYYRVSSKGQGEDDAYGLPRQHEEVRVYVEREGHEVVATFRDVGKSGATADRPGLAEMLEAEGFQAVVVPAWDRLARNTMLDGWLRYSFEKRGIRVLSATQSNEVDPMARLTQAILTAVAEFDRHAISQRLAGSRKAKARAGGYAHGQPPFGKRDFHVVDAFGKVTEKKLIPHEDEAATVADIQALRAEGLTLRAIADRLNESGRSNRKGKPWQAGSVLNVLKAAERTAS